MAEEIDNLQAMLTRCPASVKTQAIVPISNHLKSVINSGTKQAQMETMGYTFGNEKFNDTS